MNEQMEKLVEKIITIAAECVSIEEHPLCCWCGEKIATLILSAVRDGGLDEELGISKEEIEKELAFALGKGG